MNDRLSFGDFCLDGAQGRLVQGDERCAVPLTPKAYDVLHYLATRPGKLVTKDELLTTLWPDVIVGDASIKVAVSEIRKALADDPETPKFIETVHRRGYRFIASVTAGADRPAAAEAREVREAAYAPPPPRLPPAADIVGRDGELRRLVQSLVRTGGGERQCVFVAGSAGCGKSALIGQFLRKVQSGDEEIEPPGCGERPASRRCSSPWSR